MQDFGEKRLPSNWRSRLTLPRSPWMRLLLFVSIAIGLYATSQIVINRTLLYMQTGSVWLHDYSYYSFDSVAHRFCTDPLKCTPVNSTASCAAPSKPSPHQAFLTEDTFFEATGLPRLRFVRAESHPLRGLPSRIHAEGHGATRVHVLADDDADLAPWLWDAVIGAKGVSFKAFSNYGVEFVRVQSDEELQRMQERGDVSHALIVGGSLHPRVLSNLREEVDVGLLLLTPEYCCVNCKEGRDLTAPLPDRVRFLLMPYGDCILMDNSRVVMWPLGPSVLRGFPSQLDPRDNPPIAKRDYDLNLMVTISPSKSWRMQSWMAARDACEGPSRHGLRPLNCYIHWNNFFFKIAETVDEALHTNLRSLSNAPSEYVDLLRQSTFTLCPAGKNPEQYRIWEAIMAGSIPVIEDPAPFAVHPGYGNKWRCQREDTHRILKELGAPVEFVRDWERELPALLLQLKDPAALQTRQDALREWWAALIVHLRLLVLRQVMTYMR